MGARIRNLVRIPAVRHCSEERANTLEQSIDKSGCTGLPIIFHNEVESMRDLPPVFCIKTRCCRDTETGNVFKRQCGSSGTGERRLLEAMWLSQMEEHKSFTSTESDTKQNVKEINTCRRQSSSTSLSHFSPSCMLQNTHQSHDKERKDLSFPRRRQPSVV